MITPEAQMLVGTDGKYIFQEDRVKVACLKEVVHDIRCGCRVLDWTIFNFITNLNVGKTCQDT